MIEDEILRDLAGCRLNRLIWGGTQSTDNTVTCKCCRKTNLGSVKKKHSTPKFTDLSKPWLKRSIVGLNSRPSIRAAACRSNHTSISSRCQDCGGAIPYALELSSTVLYLPRIRALKGRANVEHTVLRLHHCTPQELAFA